jgi:hypothetical protein
VYDPLCSASGLTLKKRVEALPNQALWKAASTVAAHLIASDPTIKRGVTRVSTAFTPDAAYRELAGWPQLPEGTRAIRLPTVKPKSCAAEVVAAALTAMNKPTTAEGAAEALTKQRSHPRTRWALHHIKESLSQHPTDVTAAEVAKALMSMDVDCRPCTLQSRPKLAALLQTRETESIGVLLGDRHYYKIEVGRSRKRHLTLTITDPTTKKRVPTAGRAREAYIPHIDSELCVIWCKPGAANPRSWRSIMREPWAKMTGASHHGKSGKGPPPHKA